MSTHLKLIKLTDSPERFVAFEYESDIYLAYSRTTQFPNISWQSGELSTDEVAGVLRNRGWHTTDIGDEFDEARTHFQRAV
jgi:hypothetical protein